MIVRLWVLSLSMLALAGCGGEESASVGTPDPVVADPTPEPAPDPEPESDGPPGWILQESGTTAPINVVAAVDGSHAWTGTELVLPPQVIGGDFRRTQDGGATWDFLGEVPENQIQVVQYAPTVLSLQFFDAKTGIALSRFSVLSTSDGGQTWITRKNTLVARYIGMFFIDASTGWVVSEKSGEVSKTTDGGVTWNFVSNPGLGRAIKFADNQTGWFAHRTGTGGETVSKTTDGGASWQASLYLEGDYDALWIRDIAVAGPDRAWVVANGNTGADIIWATADGGATWTQQACDGSGGLSGVHFVDALNGWTVGKKIHHTTDGGSTWTVQPTEQEGFRDVHFVSPTTGWVVGVNGVILKTTTKGVK